MLQSDVLVLNYIVGSFVLLMCQIPRDRFPRKFLVANVTGNSSLVSDLLAIGRAVEIAGTREIVMDFLPEFIREYTYAHTIIYGYFHMHWFNQLRKFLFFFCI